MKEDYFDFKYKDEDSYNSLQRACEYARPAVVLELLKLSQEVDLNQSGPKNRTPLIEACASD
jgi:hypothetical protein